ncbi:MAG TPA: glycosyl transferase, partial [Chitinophagaceae bacterium]|nr:glycosyl transferase [Chitinophagaceae bacterium]
MAKFLIIRFSSIGDIVLTTPVIRCLKKQVPDAEIHFLTKDTFRSIVEHNPYIDKLYVLAHSWELMIEELKVEEYDYIIDL